MLKYLWQLMFSKTQNSPMSTEDLGIIGKVVDSLGKELKTPVTVDLFKIENEYQVYLRFELKKEKNCLKE